MIRLAFLVSGLALVGCGDKGEDTGGGSEADGSAPACAVNAVSPAYPSSDGQPDFYYRADVEFKFDGIDEDATLTVKDLATGTDVAGTAVWTDSTLAFTPSAPFATANEFTATLSHCAGESSVGFTTSSLGSALEGDLSSLNGRTYKVGLDGARFVEPAGVGSLLLGLLEQDILLGVVSATDTELEMMGAISVDGGGEQDRCEPSIEFPEVADFTSSPFFQIGPQDTTLSAAGYDIQISQLRISGDFSTDGTYIGGAILSGEIDARDIVGALVGGGLLEEEDPQAVCDLIGTFGVACAECSSDGQAYCLNLYVDQITATEEVFALVAQDECDPDACTEGCEEAE
jgi:hypothetical protein